MTINSTTAIKTITIEDIEALADTLETNEAAERRKLARLIRAHARILAVREPEHFRRMPTEYADEDGHWDTSFPPAQQYRAHTGPCLLEIRDCSTSDVATSGGYYYDWKRITEDAGLFVARDGQIWGCAESGTGRLGRFAAHPGDCDVDVEIDWSVRDDVSTADLRDVEQRLRKLAFPLSQVS